MRVEKLKTIDYFGYVFMDYIAWSYVCKHFCNGDGYSVIDFDGMPILGLVVPNKPNHVLQWIKEF